MRRPTARQIARVVAVFERWRKEERTVYAMAGFRLAPGVLAVGVRIKGHLEVVLDTLIVRGGRGFVHVVDPEYARSIKFTTVVAGLEIDINFEDGGLLVADHELLTV